jgi:hypothetical protein
MNARFACPCGGDLLSAAPADFTTSGELARRKRRAEERYRFQELDIDHLCADCGAWFLRHEEWQSADDAPRQGDEHGPIWGEELPVQTTWFQYRRISKSHVKLRPVEPPPIRGR